ncbi:MAG: ribosome recycling factor [Candidatus Saccharimonadales bacterium]
MDLNQSFALLKQKLATAADHFDQELKKIRTGRAHPGMVDSLMVEVYGQNMPIRACAAISTPEPQLLQIAPFDASNLDAISSAISKDTSLGLNPVDDGRVIRIQIPPLTTETRQQMVKLLHGKVEESMVAVRQIRHEILKKAEAAEKQKQIGKSDLERLEKQIDEAVAEQKTKLEAKTAAKEKEILTV